MRRLVNYYYVVRIQLRYVHYCNTPQESTGMSAMKKFNFKMFP